jgi:hypothetical protein
MTGRMAGVALAALMVSLVDAQAQVAGPKLLVRGAAAKIEIIPEDRADIVAVVTPGSEPRLPAPEVRREGATLVIDGKLERRIRGCMTTGPAAAPKVVVNGVGGVRQDALPTITIRAPRALVAEIANAGLTQVGPTASASLEFNGCGDAKVAPVAGNLALQLNGSGDVDFTTVGGALSAQLDGSGDIRGGQTTGAARLALDGSGDVRVGAIGGGLTAGLDGSGDIVAEAISGPADLSLDGSGDILVRAGQAPTLIARLDGSGDIAFLGVAGDVDLGLDGSGDIRVARATGQVRQSEDGSGDIQIGR